MTRSARGLVVCVAALWTTAASAEPWHHAATEAVKAALEQAGQGSLWTEVQGLLAPYAPNWMEGRASGPWFERGKGRFAELYGRPYEAGTGYKLRRDGEAALLAAGDGAGPIEYLLNLNPVPATLAHSTRVSMFQALAGLGIVVHPHAGSLSLTIGRVIGDGVATTAIHRRALLMGRRGQALVTMHKQNAVLDGGEEGPATYSIYLGAAGGPVLRPRGRLLHNVAKWLYERADQQTNHRIAVQRLRGNNPDQRLARELPRADHLRAP
ncbi:MAG: hypothetical protein IT371_04680 [Deltaproteobacteria bacterium]|nr:hypothetical protein [Deltaproteobacteria bacterium]